MFVSSLSGFCEQLQVSEDVYAVGHTSRIVASELAGLPSAKARRKVGNFFIYHVYYSSRPGFIN